MNGCCDCQRDLAKLQDEVNTLYSVLSPQLSGRPIIMIDDPDDIACFDSNGDGSGYYAGYAFCDGQNHGGYVTRDLRDRFVVGAGQSYSVGNTGGFNSVTLDVTMIPSHNHTLTDPGHNHDITDPGHGHAVTDLGHDHAASQVAHSHNGTTDVNGEHTHVPSTDPGDGIVTSNNNGVFVDNSGSSEVNVDGALAPAGDHDHTFTTNSQTPAVTVNSAFTGVSVASNLTGITETEDQVTGITIANTGGGLPHENRPPFYAVIFIQRVSANVI